MASLKQLLLQQLRQQISASPDLAAAAAEWQHPLQPESIQLLMPTGTNDKLGTAAAAGGSDDGSAAGTRVLHNSLTVSDVYEMWPGCGPEVQVQYRLLLQQQQQQPVVVAAAAGGAAAAAGGGGGEGGGAAAAGGGGGEGGGGGGEVKSN
jgi:hypothetical protein